MIVLLGSAEDAMVRCVYEHCRQDNRAACIYQERDLFESCFFALERGASRYHGFMRFHNTEVAFEKWRGVLLRLPRRWWPAPDFSVKDQVFVYHETIAAWYSVITTLACPVINRFDLGWWVQDVNYPLRLAARLASMLGIKQSDPMALHECSGRLVPTPPPNDGAQYAYLVGTQVLWPPACCNDAVAVFDSRQAVLTKWQRETGILLSRIDFQVASTPQLQRVEPFPLIDEESPDVIERISAALLGLMG